MIALLATNESGVLPQVTVLSLLILMVGTLVAFASRK